MVAPYKANPVSMLRAFLGAIAENTYIEISFGKSTEVVVTGAKMELSIHISRLGAFSETFEATLKHVLRSINAQFLRDGVRPKWIYHDRRGFERALIAAQQSNERLNLSALKRFDVEIEVD